MVELGFDPVLKIFDYLPSPPAPFPNTSICAKLSLGHLTNLLSVSGVLTTLSGDNPEERRI